LSLDIKQNITTANVENIGKGFILNKQIEKNHAKKWYDLVRIKAQV